MAKQSSDWLDEILFELVMFNYDPYKGNQDKNNKKSLDQAKQAILSKTKEQALEMLPEKKKDRINHPMLMVHDSGYNKAIDQMKANIIKGEK